MNYFHSYFFDFFGYIGEALFSAGPNDGTISRCPQKRICQAAEGVILAREETVFPMSVYDMKT